MSSVPTTRPDESPQQREQREARKAQARLRAAACRDRLRTASDALAAADLLLGLNWSVRQCGAEAER